MQKLKTDPTKTVLVISVGFTLVYLITKWNWAISVSFVVGLAGVLSGYLSKQIDFLWMKLTWLLSLIVPNILLGLIFYLFLFPVSLISKIARRNDPLVLKNHKGSVYRSSPKQFGKSSFENPW